MSGLDKELRIRIALEILDFLDKDDQREAIAHYIKCKPIFARQRRAKNRPQHMQHLFQTMAGRSFTQDDIDDIVDFCEFRRK